MIKHCTREEFQLLLSMAVGNSWSVDEVKISLESNDPWEDFKENFTKRITDKYGLGEFDVHFWEYFEAPFEDMPLYLNERLISDERFVSFKNIVAQWRLKIGK